MPPGGVEVVAFDLRPTSCLFPKGHHVRLALGGAGRDHFASVPAAAETMRNHCGVERPSRIDLPAVGRAPMA